MPHILQNTLGISVAAKQNVFPCSIFLLDHSYLFNVKGEGRKATNCCYLVHVDDCIT